MMKYTKYLFQALAVYLFFLISKIIGLQLSRKISSQLFKKIGPIFKSKSIIDKNLFKFSNNLSLKEKNKIKSSMWANYGKTFVEYLFLKKFRKNNDHIIIEGENILREISKKNQPVIFISGHFANFELMSMEITKKNINLATIYRPLNNIFINFFMEYLRKKYVCKNQIKKGLKGVKEAIDYLNKKHSIALMIDQRVSEGDKIKFFNENALTSTLPAQLAIKYNLNIVPIFIEREHDNFFKMKIYEPIKSSDFKNKIDLTRNLNQILEGMIIKNPYQWIWTHNRWK
jgi:KDO2-lipid IV(A) lauroyltransferase